MSATQFTARQEQAIRRVVERATANPEVRQLALADARAAVNEYGGAELPIGAKVTFVERAPGIDALIVMPPAGQTVELGSTSAEEQALFGPVLTRAASDAAFRRRAAADARTAIKEVTGHRLPEHVAIAFYDQSADTDLVAVLPPLVEEAAELSEEELETVAGGTWCACTSCCVSIKVEI